MYISGTSLSSTAQTASTTDREALLQKGNKFRKITAGAFFGMIPFMVFFFYRHKVLEIPGAYTSYAFFEWGLIIFVSVAIASPLSADSLTIPHRLP